MNSRVHSHWQSAAVNAAGPAIADRLRDVTASWAAARHRYLALWSANPENISELRKASARYQELDRARKALREQVALSEEIGRSAAIA